MARSGGSQGAVTTPRVSVTTPPRPPGSAMANPETACRQRLARGVEWRIGRSLPEPTPTPEADDVRANHPGQGNRSAGAAVAHGGLAEEPGGRGTRLAGDHGRGRR